MCVDCFNLGELCRRSRFRVKNEASKLAQERFLHQFPYLFA